MPAMAPLKGGYAADDPRLDRLPELDEASRGFPVSALLATTELRARIWKVRWALDQGREGACTNFAIAHNRIGRPRPRSLPEVALREDGGLPLAPAFNPARRVNKPSEAEALARVLYRRSQQLDEWPGEEPAYSGTSALAACKAWREAGLLDEYRWGFGIDDALATLANLGALCFATEWLDGMFEPRPDGLLEVTGSVAGGHMYSMIGVVPNPQRSPRWRRTGEREPLLLGWQSWGDDWGPLGALFAMRAADAERLLKGVRWPGECVVPLDR